ncbi:MAG: hypothetical protein CM1200mP2_36140 [Planctomycetaceae bacterium]|nr:MAG: hypothetical protein CM1200mP2_36140 [Planctomycetaceae bacterium]
MGHASDDGPSQCPRCGAEVVDAPSENDATGKAREFLERWATDDPLGNHTTRRRHVLESTWRGDGRRPHRNVSEPASPPPPRPPSTKRPPPSGTTGSMPHTQNPTPPPSHPRPPRGPRTPWWKHRRPGPPKPGPQTSQTPQRTRPTTTRSTRLPRRSPNLQGPPNHPFRLTTPSRSRPTHRPPGETHHDFSSLPPGATTSALTHSTSLWGQLLAYVGVLGLTAGGA